MKNPKYKLAFPGKHVLVFNKHPMTQFNGYTLGTTAFGLGIISADKTKGFYGDSANLLVSAGEGYSLSGLAHLAGRIEDNVYYFGRSDDIISAFFRETTVRNVVLHQSQGGEIIAIPMTGLIGDEITLSSNTSSHWNFSGYSITGATLTGDKFVFGNSDVTAKGVWYEDPIRQINLVQTSGGWLSANKLSGYDGDVITLVPIPSSHFTFSSYGLTGATLTGNDFELNGNNITASALWKQDPIYTGTLIQTEGGTISLTPLTGFSGDELTLNNTPSSHYTFGNYFVSGGEASISGNILTVGSANFTVSGRFVQDPLRNLTLQQTAGGIISANKLNGYDNDVVTLSNTANNDYNFTQYNVNGATLTGSQFKFNGSNVTANATFTKKPTRSVTLTQQTGGTITANPMTGYDGTVVTLSNTANAGYTFNNYSITGATLTGNKFTLTGGNVTVKPNYTHNVYNLTLQTNGNGKLVAGKTTGYYNDTTTLTPTPSSNYKFNNYSVTGGTITNNTFKWGTSNATAKANFIYNSNSARIALGYNTTPTAIVSAGRTYYPYTIQFAPVVKGITGEIPFDVMCNGETACIYAHDNNTPNSYSMGNRITATYDSTSSLNSEAIRTNVKRLVLHGGTQPFEVRYRSNLNYPTDYAKCWMLYANLYIGTNDYAWGPDKWETLSNMNTKKNGYSMYNTTFNTVAYDGAPSGLVAGCWIQYNLDYQNSIYSWPDQFISKQNDIVDIYW